MQEKNFKKKYGVVLAIILFSCMYLFLEMSSCANRDEMLHVVIKEMCLEDDSSIKLIDVQYSEDGQSALLICELGSPYASRLLGWRFKSVWKNHYKLERGYGHNNEFGKIKEFLWEDKCVIVINDPEASMYTAVLSGADQVVTIDELPEVLIFKVSELKNITVYDNVGRPIY